MSDIFFVNPPGFFNPFSPLFKKHLFLRFGNRQWEFELHWTLFRITCKDPHIDELDNGRPVFLQKLVKGNFKSHRKLSNCPLIQAYDKTERKYAMKRARMTISAICFFCHFLYRRSHVMSSWHNLKSCPPSLRLLREKTPDRRLFIRILDNFTLSFVFRCF